MSQQRSVDGCRLTRTLASSASAAARAAAELRNDVAAARPFKKRRKSRAKGATATAKRAAHGALADVVVGRDTTRSLFRALGKLLHVRRLPPEGQEPDGAPGRRAALVF